MQYLGKYSIQYAAIGCVILTNRKLYLSCTDFDDVIHVAYVKST